MTDVTPRLRLPFIMPGQAQKEMYHNEALVQLDVLVSGAVEEEPRVSPPPSPAAGQSFIVGADPTGAWAGQAAAIAAYDSYGWRFLTPAEGCTVWVKSRGVPARFAGGAWTVGAVTADRLEIGGQQVVGERAAAIADPSGGSVLDAEARSAIASILSAMRAHGLIEA